MSSSVNEYVDRFIRKSVIGRNLSRVREKTPWLYGVLRNVYSRLFHIDSSNKLARYQIRAVQRFLKFVPENVLKKGVLEVGSDLDAKVIRELHGLGCPKIVGVNPVFSQEDLNKFNPTLPTGCKLQCADMRNTNFSDESFGALFSVSVFEHLLDFEQCLSEMHRILIPGGMVYAEFGPIWSSSLGHHVFANVNDEKARHWDPKLNPLENHSHLLQSREAMGREISGKVSVELCEAILQWVYEGQDINRLFFEDYLRMIENSPFEVILMDTDHEYISDDILQALKKRHPEYETFDIRNVEIVLRKGFS